MGPLFGAALNAGKSIVCIQLFGRTLILPFLFNAILAINAGLADPFDGGQSDFPGERYEKALEVDCKAFVSAVQNAPSWLHERNEIASKKWDEKFERAQNMSPSKHGGASMSE